MSLLSRLRWPKNLTHRKTDSSFTCTITVLISMLLLPCFKSVHERRVRLRMCTILPAGFIFLSTILSMYELLLHGSQRSIEFWIKMIRLCCCLCMFLHLLSLNENSTHSQERKAAAFFRHEKQNESILTVIKYSCDLITLLLSYMISLSAAYKLHNMNTQETTEILTILL